MNSMRSSGCRSGSYSASCVMIDQRCPERILNRACPVPANLSSSGTSTLAPASTARVNTTSQSSVGLDHEKRHLEKAGVIAAMSFQRR